MILSTALSSCASKSQVVTDYRICVLNLDKQTSTCGGKLTKQDLPNSMLNGYVCMSPDDFEFYALGCQQDKIDLKKCLEQ